MWLKLDHTLPSNIKYSVKRHFVAFPPEAVHPYVVWFKLIIQQSEQFIYFHQDSQFDDHDDTIESLIELLEMNELFMQLISLYRDIGWWHRVITYDLSSVMMMM